MKDQHRSTAPRGGDAAVVGDDSSARGGDAGRFASSPGGRGGDALVRGNRSLAIGGLGGGGGLGQGGPGGDADVHSDNALAWGGQGGEAAQHDGRGGRGGRAPGLDQSAELFGTKFRPRHMRWPYGEPVTEPGRGGDSPDTPQYMARRIIVEDIKGRYFAQNGLPEGEVWWDRIVVPLEWINAELMAAGHRWGVTIVDDEYSFSDV